MEKYGLNAGVAALNIEVKAQGDYKSAQTPKIMSREEIRRMRQNHHLPSKLNKFIHWT